MSNPVGDDSVAAWSFDGYEMVVGLEVHVELATRNQTVLGVAEPVR